MIVVGLLRDITTILANEKVNVLALPAEATPNSNRATIDMTIEIYNLGKCWGACWVNQPRCQMLSTRVVGCTGVRPKFARIYNVD